MINGQFLRTSLEEFLTTNGISAETTLSVEYVRALIPPLHVASYEHDDWVSSVDVLSASSKPVKWGKDVSFSSGQERILSGSYDGLLRVWNMSSEVVATSEAAHTAAIKAAKFVSPTQIASAGFDKSLRLWKYAEPEELGGKGSLTSTLELYGHKGAVDRLAVHAPSSRLLSASADHTVGFWSTKKSDAPSAPENLLPTSNKRRKLAGPAKTVSQRGPLSLMSGHTSQVSDVCFDEKDSTVAYSSSWDHSVKTWDLTTSACVDTRTTAQSLFSITHLPDLSLLATGTSARHITLIDPRASATTISAMTLRGHQNAVVSLAKDPSSTYGLVSGSHDGTCKVWDIRSVQTSTVDGQVGEPVYTISRESASGKARTVGGEGVKVFSVCWDKDVGILSAGEDKRVQINKGSQ